MFISNTQLQNSHTLHQKHFESFIREVPQFSDNDCIKFH